MKILVAHSNINNEIAMTTAYYEANEAKRITVTRLISSNNIDINCGRYLTDIDDAINLLKAIKAREATNEN